MKGIEMSKSKAKLFWQVRSTHIMDSFRVDLIESGDPFGKMNESVAFEVLGANESYIDVRVLHIIYTEHGGERPEDSDRKYRLWIKKEYNDPTKVERIKE